MTATRDQSTPDGVALSTAVPTVDDVVAVARHGARVELTGEARTRVEQAREAIDALAARAEPVYGVSTGFGALATRYIEPDRRAALQRAVVRSHAAGFGDAMPVEVVRATMFLRARSLASGHSGVRAEVLDTLLALLRHGLTPVVPEHGSLGCSGDLAPLSHIGLALMGEGVVVDTDGVALDAGDALAAHGIDAIELREKEGLALINGTDGMLAMLVLACVDARNLVRAIDIAAAMTVEALLGTDRAFADDLMQLRPHPGAITSAANLRRLLEGSPIVASHREGDARVQDAYSLRCAPQLAGAVRDTLAFVETIAGRELAAAIDNPVVLDDGRVESNGNFHGAPLGYAADFLAIALADAGSMAERRTDRMLDATRSHGLPPFLADDPGVDSGLMIAHYTAAALVSENRRLAAPASVDSIPTSAMQEDHVSMGWAATRKLREVVANLAAIVGIEALAAARALDLRAPLTPAAGTGAARDALRAVVPGPGPDRWTSPEVAAAHDLVASGAFVTAVEAAIGPLE